MAVDFIPYAYMGMMRVWDGSTVPVSWAPVDEATPLLPFATCFRSGHSQPWGRFDDGGIGEITDWRAPRSFAKVPARVCNDCYIGDPSWWDTPGWPDGTPGVTLAADGWPVDCNTGGVPFSFGWTLGFES